MPLNNPDHPFWLTAKTAIVGVIGLVALFITATQFDETEIKAWAPVMAALAGSEFLQHVLRKRKESKE